jgi:hypothetical protein
MCFSPEADFASGALIGTVGAMTLAEARDKNELPLAVLPLAFAVHQIVEGFVWLGLEGKVDKSVGDAAMYTYLFYAWALLPFLAPLAVMLVEPLRRRRRLMGCLTVLGAAVGLHLLIALATEPISAHITGHTIDYQGIGDSGNVVTALYILASCGSFILSSQRRIRWFGIANIAAVIAVAWVQSEGLTSLWCIWGATVSVLFLMQFRDWRREERDGDRGATSRGSPVLSRGPRSLSQ